MKVPCISLTQVDQLSPTTVASIYNYFSIITDKLGKIPSLSLFILMLESHSSHGIAKHTKHVAQLRHPTEVPDITLYLSLSHFLYLYKCFLAYVVASLYIVPIIGPFSPALHKCPRGLYFILFFSFFPLRLFIFSYYYSLNLFSKLPILIINDKPSICIGTHPKIASYVISENKFNKSEKWRA